VNRAIFLDRDGVLNEPVIREGKPHPPADAAELRLTAGVKEALSALKREGFLLIVVTNQPDVARGSANRCDIEQIHQALGRALPIDDFYACYHDDADHCTCRKPLPGLILAGAARYEVDLADSYMVGDRWRDIDAGAAAGCRTVLIDRGYREPEPRNAPNFRSSTLAEAVQWILADSGCIQSHKS